MLSAAQHSSLFAWYLLLQVLERAPVQPMNWQGCHGSLPLAAASGANSNNGAGLPFPPHLAEALGGSRQRTSRSMMHLPHQQQTAATQTPLCSMRRDSAPDSSYACLGSIASPRASPAPHGSCSHALRQSGSASSRLFGPNPHTQAQLLQQVSDSPDQQLGSTGEDAASRLGVTGSGGGATSARPEINLTFEMCARSEPSCH